MLDTIEALTPELLTRVRKQPLRFRVLLVIAVVGLCSAIGWYRRDFWIWFITGPTFSLPVRLLVVFSTAIVVAIGAIVVAGSRRRSQRRLLRQFVTQWREFERGL